MERLYHLFNLDREVTVARRVRVANRSQERRKGLLGITQLDQDSGLWICPCEGIHTFGMKTKLDVIFLDRTHRVRKICHALAANRIRLCLSASSVVELAPGRLAETGTQVNDQLEFRAA